jgi:nucleoside-diphosphate-sugar epimerase
VTDVVHCAAIVSFDPAKAGELQAVNVEGARNVLEFMELIQTATLHYVSTVFIAGRRRGPVRETDLDGAAGFNNAYEESKFLAELEVRKAMANGLPTVVYRPSILVGDSRTGQTQSFIGFYILLRSLELVALRARRLAERKPTHIDADGVMVGDGRVTIPLRVQGSESKTLNIIPVDYAIRAMRAIFQDPDSLGKTFHIVNPTPPTIGQLRDWMCAALGMRGVMLVNPGEFAHKPMNRWERLFAKSTEEYGAYLDGEEPAFQAENTLKLIRREEVPQPCTDADFIRRLVDYCQASRWGKRRVKLPVGHPIRTPAQ